METRVFAASKALTSEQITTQLERAVRVVLEAAQRSLLEEQVKQRLGWARKLTHKGAPYRNFPSSTKRQREHMVCVCLYAVQHRHLFDMSILPEPGLVLTAFFLAWMFSEACERCTDSDARSATVGLCFSAHEFIRTPIAIRPLP